MPPDNYLLLLFTSPQPQQGDPISLGTEATRRGGTSYTPAHPPPPALSSSHRAPAVLPTTADPLLMLWPLIDWGRGGGTQTPADTLRPELVGYSMEGKLLGDRPAPR